MHFEGSYSFDAMRHTLWDLLNDPDVLARITPGLKQLELRQPDDYKATFHIKMGPIDSVFDGSLKVAEKISNESYKLLVDVDAKIGIISAEGSIGLREEGPTTTVSFSGEANLSGKLAQMGQRVMSGVGRLFTSQFFKGLEKELNAAPAVIHIQEEDARDECTPQANH